MAVDGKIRIFFILTFYFVMISANFYRKEEITLGDECLNERELKARSAIECNLRCKRKSLTPFMKENICFCVTGECKKDGHDIVGPKGDIYQPVIQVSKTAVTSIN